MQELTLDGMNIGDDGIISLGPHLAKMMDIQNLDLRLNNIHEGGFQLLVPHLAHLVFIKQLKIGSNTVHFVPNMHACWLNRCGTFGAMVLGPHLGNLKQIQVLDLTNNDLGDLGVTSLGPTWPVSLSSRI